MSLLAPVVGLVWEIVSTTVVTYAVPWLSEFVLQRILPLWQRYWPVIYQSVLVPAYHLVSDTIQPLLHDLRSNHGDSSAVSASESPPGETSESSEGSELDSLPVLFPGGEETTTVRQAFGMMRTDEVFETGMRGMTARNERRFRRQTKAAIIIQSHCRKYLARLHYMKLKKAAITTQCAWRAKVARSELRKLKLKLKMAVTAAIFTDPADMEAEMNHPQVQRLILERAAAQARSSTSATRAPAGGTSAKTAKDLRTEYGAAVGRTYKCYQDVLQEAAAIASYASATQTLAGWTSAVTAATTAKDLITAAGAVASSYTFVQDVLQEAAPRARRATKASIWSKISRVW